MVARAPRPRSARLLPLYRTPGSSKDGRHTVRANAREVRIAREVINRRYVRACEPWVRATLFLLWNSDHRTTRQLGPDGGCPVGPDEYGSRLPRPLLPNNNTGG